MLDPFFLWSFEWPPVTVYHKDMLCVQDRHNHQDVPLVMTGFRPNHLTLKQVARTV